MTLPVPEMTLLTVISSLRLKVRLPLLTMLLATEPAGYVAIAELESAGGDGGEAGVGIVGGEDRGARAELHELTGAGDGAEKRPRIAAVECQDGVVNDRAAAGGSAGAAVSKLEGTGGHGGGAGEGVVGGEDGRACAELLELARAGDGG